MGRIKTRQPNHGEPPTMKSIQHQLNKLENDHRFAEGTKKQDALEMILHSAITEFLRNGEKIGSELPHLKKEILDIVNRKIKILS